MSVSTIDIIVLVIYVVGTRLFFAWLYSRKVSRAEKEQQEGAQQYFLAGRELKWPLIGLSFYVANMSGSTFVALPGSGYAHGIAVYNYEWLPSLILIFFAAWFLPLYLRNQIYTTPQYLERRFGRFSRLAFSGFLIFANIFIDAAGAFFAIGIIAEALFPSVPFWVLTSTIALAAGLYIFTGGLGLVVINDVLQASLIVVGGAVVSVLAYLKLPDWNTLTESTPPEALHLIRPVSDPEVPWPGVFSGILIIGIYFWCTNQDIMQRALGAKDLNHGRWGSLFAGFLKLINLFVLILPGVMASYFYEDLSEPDLAFPRLAFDLLPVGLRGLILAAFAAAILSSLEAMLNAASTLFTMDFVRTMRPDTSDSGLVKSGRVATIAFMVIAALWAPVIYRFETLWQYLQSSLSYITPPVVVVFLFGAFWRRANATGAISTLCAGVPIGVVGWFSIEVLDLFSLQYLYACGLLFVLNSILIVSVSLCSPAPDYDSIRDVVWTKPFRKEEREKLSHLPWWKNYRTHSLLLIAVTLAIVIWWW